MGAADFLRRLGASYVSRVNEQNGNAAAERASSQEADASLMRRAQAAAIIQRLQSQPALDASEIELRKAQSGMYTAHGDAFAHPTVKPGAVSDADPIMDDAMNVLGYRSKKPGTDGKIHFWDNQGRPVPSDGPMVQAPAGVSIGGQKAPAPTAQPTAPTAPRVPIGGQSPAAAALASVGGGAPAGPTPPAPTPAPAGPQPSIPPTYRTKAAPRAPQPKQPHLVAGTNAQGEAVWGAPGTPGFAPPLPAVEKTRVAQAGHVIEQAQALINDYKANPDLFGMKGVLNSARSNSALGTMVLGQPDPRWSRIAAGETSLAAFQPIMHGSRGGEGLLAHFQNVIAKNPAIGAPQRIAAVGALIQAASRIQHYGPEADLSDLYAAAGAPGGGEAGGAGGFRVVGVRPAQ